MVDETRKIHITRKGQQFGPYPEDIAKQYLSEGKLQGSDLAWHAGADGWKPLEKLLAGEEETKTAEPPPTPAPVPPTEAASDGPPPDTAVHISREGEKHGPYKYETAKIHLEGGQLLPTDSAWHEGMDGWKPLGELYSQVVPGSTEQITATGGQSGVCTYTDVAEEELKQSQLMFVGIMMIVGCVWPLIFIGESMGSGWSFLGWILPGGLSNIDSKIYFLNFQAVSNFESALLLIGPLVIGITMVAMAKTTKDPVRCSVAMGLCLLLFIMQIGSNGVGSLFGGRFLVFFLGWLCLIMGCRARHMRPANLPAYIIALVGGGFICLFWLIPSDGGGVPLIDTFRDFKGNKIQAIAGLFFMGAQFAAAIICFTTTRSKSNNVVADKSSLSIKLLVGSILVLSGLFFADFAYDMFKGDTKFGDKLGAIVTVMLILIKLLAWFVGLLLILPITASDLLTRLMRR
jgi:hypothetical protein